MAKPKALILLPGAGGSSGHKTFLEIEKNLSPFPVIRQEFGYRKLGKKWPPKVPSLIGEVGEIINTSRKEHKIKSPKAVLLGGRSFGGRVCSVAVSEGTIAAGLVLLSYPLHPPGKPENLRTEHFPKINVPCLFISSDNDPFGSPKEFASNFKLIDAPVTSLFLAGGGHNPASKSHLKEISDAISQWITTLT